MVKMCDVESVQKIANYLGVPLGKLTSINEQMVRSMNNQIQRGYATILTQLLKESKIGASEKESSFEALCEIRQWIDYTALFVGPGTRDKHVVRELLTELDNFLLTRSYFVGYAMTLADLAVFYAINSLMKSLTPNEKEKYLNLSRWFNHLQQIDKIQQGSDLLNFTTIHLHGWVTGTHL